MLQKLNTDVKIVQIPKVLVVTMTTLIGNYRLKKLEWLELIKSLITH